MPAYEECDVHHARQILRDNSFDRVASDDELAALVAKFAIITSTPYVEILRRMLGMEQVNERAARTLFRRVLAHRRRLSKALGRQVHVRVAALDMLSIRTARSKNDTERDSLPIVVTPLFIERALDEASSDSVTGLPQRAHFVSLVRHELCQRHRRNVAVVFIDLDGFKNVNDEHGHGVGDEVLRIIARLARATLRSGDVIARIGGDEFALLLLEVSTDEAEIVVERLRMRFEARTARYGTSFSAGIVLAQPGDTPDGLLLRADARMYRDKRTRAARSSEHDCRKYFQYVVVK
ncbi:MAG: GGDEF domain-containing protein [Polyangiaceae bacterium]|nr:GGDEF domain-containing protein [Polyangiaceae bacterium]